MKNHKNGLKLSHTMSNFIDNEAMQ